MGNTRQELEGRYNLEREGRIKLELYVEGKIIQTVECRTRVFSTLLFSCPHPTIIFHTSLTITHLTVPDPLFDPPPIPDPTEHPYTHSLPASPPQPLPTSLPHPCLPTT
ncbi:hypothetical protein Pcinc_019486 [Petrolisthes cinctipes]|uniref:Uncharacterized protein n=1 Tax=Petrolisthes cinctipes TaxID=88211 RepID=A0AAE1FL91_PETCI|nr:hypothetical protein Pcinc_019486 [Petrolisthes cinctipes]